MTFVDNHDVSRLATILTNKNHISLAYGLLFGMPVFRASITEVSGRGRGKSSG